jgi:hypothetical protein
VLSSHDRAAADEHEREDTNELGEEMPGRISHWACSGNVDWAAKLGASV